MREHRARVQRHVALAYLKSVAKLLPNAMRTPSTAYIEAKLNEAVDKVRRAESAGAAGKGS